MKILLGTPIHELKDKLMASWLKNVAKIDHKVDFLMVDSSLNPKYVDRVKDYCKKYGIENFQIKHFDINQDFGMDEMIGRSREIIRQEVLSKGYDAWFSWECGEPGNPRDLKKLAKLMQREDYSIIHQTYEITTVPIEFYGNFAYTLINRNSLEKFGFLLEYPNMPQSWYKGEEWFKNQVVKSGGSYVETYGNIGKFKNVKSKILIGTAIHQVKDYVIERWIKNVSKIKYRADILMVDNSPNLNFIKKVRTYCKKYKLENYKIGHLELAPELVPDRRVEMSQEIIRQEVLSKGYDAWFSWECDQLIPEDSLAKLISMMNSGNFDMVNHNGWARQNSVKTCTDFNVSLVSKRCLEKYGLLFEYGEYPDFPEPWVPGEVWIKRELLKSGGSILEAEGVIEPIYHLDKP